ncbi:unnamed protein product [Arabidopsis arenosa]|uniref:Inositol oxygenase n=1 Tax=Arabidopsis arenosa TaxID=38785 RepID=A0A8S1ZD89_ARAAE|nr:unnamed protein product [Arabidopsis arenosa]
MYTKSCGLDIVFISWGHDDYIYLVSSEGESNYITITRSVHHPIPFYALCKSEEYKHLMKNEDRENMKWLKVFNKCDLYSKRKIRSKHTTTYGHTVAGLLTNKNVKSERQDVNP